MNNAFKKLLDYKRPAFWIFAAALCICIAVGLWCLTRPAPKQPGGNGSLSNRPMLLVDDVFYVDPFMPLSYLPEGYSSAGTLAAAQAYNTGLEGTEYFRNPEHPEDFYTHQLCGTPVDLNTVDSEHLQWQYLRWIRIDAEISAARTLTLDDVRRLAEPDREITMETLSLYASEEIGSGLYVRRYPIDARFALLVGAGSPAEAPMYVYLLSLESDECIDIRTQDVEAFIEKHSGRKE